MIQDPEYYQADPTTEGGWHWLVRAFPNQRAFVQDHEPDGFASKSNAERNFQMTTEYFVLYRTGLLQDLADATLGEALLTFGRPGEDPNGEGGKDLVVS